MNNKPFTIEISLDKSNLLINNDLNPISLCQGDQKSQHEEYQYLNHISNILNKGIKRTEKSASGIGTYSLFGNQMRYNLRNHFPLLTTKKVFWRGVVEELLWFISGSTNSFDLASKNVHIWDANSTRESLDAAGLTDRQEGDLGPIYGFQWRHYGANYEGMHANYTNKGIDQLSHIINTIKSRPCDRKLILCSWNPVDIPEMALPPSQCLLQFFVANGELSSMLYQRSGEMGLGVPFNIASYALLTCMIAHVTNLKPGDFIHTLGDSHIYFNQVEALKEQILREPRPFPTLRIKRKVESIEDFNFEDFELIGYNPYPKIGSAHSTA